MTKQEALESIIKELDSIIHQFASDYQMHPDKAAGLARMALFSGPVSNKLREEFEVLREKESRPQGSS